MSRHVYYAAYVTDERPRRRHVDATPVNTLLDYCLPIPTRRHHDLSVDGAIRHADTIARRRLLRRLGAGVSCAICGVTRVRVTQEVRRAIRARRSAVLGDVLRVVSYRCGDA